MLALGARAPEFTLPNQDDQSVSLSTLLRNGPLILYFYPADFTLDAHGKPVRSATCTRTSSRRVSRLRE
jgi:peroxiredoxin